MSRFWDESKAKEKTFKASWRLRLHELIFEADTFYGKLFDIVLIIAILASVLVVMLDSIQPIREEYGIELYIIEWFFTLLFTAEYILRLISIGRPLRYATSFFGVVDLLSILPTYLSLFFPSAQYFLVIRLLRVLRIFRVLKLVQYLSDARMLMAALKASRRKVTVFLTAVITLVVIFGSIMYLVEGGEGGFDSIPHSIYWAIVTLTTVGFGDITPQTGFGKFLSAIVMIMGYAMIAVPTGIVAVEISRTAEAKITTQVCPECSREGHDADAKFCKYCSAVLNPHIKND